METLTSAKGAADKADAVFTCIAGAGVKLQQRGALWAGAGVPARSEETEMAANVLARIWYWGKKSAALLDIVKAERVQLKRRTEVRNCCF